MSESKGEGCAGTAIAIVLVLVLVGVVGCGATFLLFGARPVTVVGPASTPPPSGPVPSGPEETSPPDEPQAPAADEEDR